MERRYFVCGASENRPTGSIENVRVLTLYSKSEEFPIGEEEKIGNLSILSSKKFAKSAFPPYFSTNREAK